MQEFVSTIKRSTTQLSWRLFERGGEGYNSTFKLEAPYKAAILRIAQLEEPRGSSVFFPAIPGTVGVYQRRGCTPASRSAGQRSI